MQAITEAIQQQYEDTSILDGVKVTISKTAWILIRPSNTEPKIRITIEAENEKTAKQILEEFNKIIQPL